MENFIFSLNVTMPIFLIILLGYILKNIGFLTQEFTRVANQYVFMVALPAMLFQDIASMDVKSEMNVTFFFFCMIVTIVMFLVIWGLSHLLIKDKDIVGAFAQASARGSAAVLGVAFVENICGEMGMTPLMIVAAVPFFNILSVVILVFEGRSEDSRDYGKIKSSLVNIAKNPIIIGILLGLITSFVSIPLPTIASRSVSYVARTATPIALLAIGAGFDAKLAVAKLKPTVVASLIKLMGLPLIFLPIAYKFGFGASEMVAILVMLASPTTPSSYVMAENMHNDGVLTSSVIVLTTLMSSVTLTFWVFLLRSIGCI